VKGWLDGCVALISGGGSGIGRAVVDAFVDGGAAVGVLELVLGSLALPSEDEARKILDEYPALANSLSSEISDLAGGGVEVKKL